MKSLQTLCGKILPMLVIFLSLSGCIKEDYSDCPVPGGVYLAPTFTLHTVKDASGEYKDLFGETAQKQTVYVFDQSGLFVQKILENGPFNNGHLTKIDLPKGKYRAVIWVNAVNEDFVLSREPVAGETSIDDLLLQLKEVESTFITRHFSPLLHGITDYFTVEQTPITRAQNKVIPVNLTRSSNKIQVIIRWTDDDEVLCENSSHTDETRVYVLDKNGVLDFENNAGQCDWLTYIPKYFNGNDLKAFLNENPVAATVATEFTVLRLWTDSETKIEVHKKINDQEETKVYESELMSLLKKTKAYEDQESIDREACFVVELWFKCHHNKPNDESWITSSIIINGWKISEIDEDDTDL